MYFYDISLLRDKYTKWVEEENERQKAAEEGQSLDIEAQQAKYESMAKGYQNSVPNLGSINTGSLAKGFL